MTNAIETKDLTFRYSSAEAAVRAVALVVPQGSIYGFLGPNGAGKTTTLRLVLGLLRAQQGEIAVLGRPIQRERREVLRRVGSSIEGPSLYGDLTAAENLEVWRIVHDCPRQRIREVLDLVGLSATGRKRARQMSTGMRQRLALAIALLHEPELLVLDEPANGLDPQGILELRELLLALNRERGITIVISSHVLSEIERLVSHVGIIRRGELRFQGPLTDLVARGGNRVAMRTSDDRRAASVLAGDGMSSELSAERLWISTDGAAHAVRRLVEAGIDVHEVVPFSAGLEQVFFDLVAG